MKFIFSMLMLISISKCFAEICPNNYNLNIGIEKKEEKGKTVLYIKYTNKSKHILMIARRPPNIFVSSNGNEVPFIGYEYYDKYINKISDYEKVAPNKSTSRKINITKQYLFEKGKSYKIIVPGGYYDPIKDIYYCGEDGFLDFKQSK